MDLVADVLFVIFMFFFLQAFAILDLSVDVLFLVDLLLNFITARWIIETKAHKKKANIT